MKSHQAGPWLLTLHLDGHQRRLMPAIHDWQGAVPGIAGRSPRPAVATSASAAVRGQADAHTPNGCEGHFADVGDRAYSRLTRYL